MSYLLQQSHCSTHQRVLHATFCEYIHRHTLIYSKLSYGFICAIPFMLPRDDAGDDGIFSFILICALSCLSVPPDCYLLCHMSVNADLFVNACSHTHTLVSSSVVFSSYHHHHYCDSLLAPCCLIQLVDFSAQGAGQEVFNGS